MYTGYLAKIASITKPELELVARPKDDPDRNKKRLLKPNRHNTIQEKINHSKTHFTKMAFELKNMMRNVWLITITIEIN